MSIITTNIYTFLLVTIAITLTGVMMPGPALAGAIAKGYENKSAGLFIALGHGFIEMPIIVIIVLGFETILTQRPIAMLIGIGGGLVLACMGYTMIKQRWDTNENPTYLPHSPLTVGILTTALNPGFYIWWVTVGALLIVTGLSFGPITIVLFTLLHWSCDLGYYYLITSTVHKSKHLWSKKTHTTVFRACGMLMLGFGIWFIASTLVGN